MKLFLFGGAELNLGQGQPLKDLIKRTIQRLHPTSILHIPFARLHPTEEAFKEGWFKEIMQNTGIEILDARIETDVEKAHHPLVFINGGHDKADLIEGIKNNKKILNIILNADYIVSESSGSMVTAEYMKLDKKGEEIVRGLGILKDTIIEPHYSERNSQHLLIHEMKQAHAKYGIGIDCVTAIVIDPATFPSTWDKIGDGNVEVKRAG
ncbi:MAG: Type 1 glutamine amidotransferase-like domain-containing protein [Candidatus Pacebacteria bacterium]|nr:Type 1 glutamine amidotransferase-like domain-containing protein [Candidatus Paceibacterota bacterium]